MSALKAVELSLCLLVIIFIIVVLYDTSTAWANRKSLLFRMSPVLFRYQFAIEGHPDPSVIRVLEKEIRPLEFKPDPESRDIYFKQVFFNYAPYLEKRVRWTKLAKTGQMKMLKCLIAMHDDFLETHITVTGRLDFWVLFFFFLEIPVVLLYMYCNRHGWNLFSLVSILVFNAGCFSALVWQQSSLFHAYASQIETIIHSQSAQAPNG